MSKDEEMFLFIADISGYTAYMIANNKAREHAKLALTLLIKTLVEKIQLPLHISKLEGDAIFLYMPNSIKERDTLWITKKIFTFFDSFERRVHELKISNVCSCGACQNIDKLELKVIAHYGSASLQKISSFRELSGIDVIVLHRLLKNHIPLKRYFLMTEAAYQHMLIPEHIKMTKSEETYNDVGTLPIYVCEPPFVNPDELPYKTTMLQKFQYLYRLLFARGRDTVYHNIPSQKTSPDKA